jgi:hypothetical protein
LPFSDKDFSQTRLQTDEGTSSIKFPGYFASGLVPEIEGAKGNKKHAVFCICFQQHQWLHAQVLFGLIHKRPIKVYRLSLHKWIVGGRTGDRKVKCSAALMFCGGACCICVPNIARASFSPNIKEKSILGGYDCDIPNISFVDWQMVIR